MNRQDRRRLRRSHSWNRANFKDYNERVLRRLEADTFSFTELQRNLVVALAVVLRPDENGFPDIELAHQWWIEALADIGEQDFVTFAGKGRP